MRFVAALLLLACSAHAGAALAADTGPPRRDVSISGGPGVVHGKNEPLTATLDLTTLARLRWFLVGGTLELATMVLALNMSSAAVHAGYGWRSHDRDASHLGGPPLGGFALRASVLGTLGVRRFVYDDWMDDYDPGTSGTLAFAGARAGISLSTRPRSRSHFLVGLALTIDANLGSTTRHYDYVADGEPARGKVDLSGVRAGVVIDLGVLRDLR
jgi:hypothetical protein